jgi:glycosyltransferase 2 family protein
MTDQEQSAKPPRSKIWRYLPIVVILGLAAYMLIPQIAELTRAWYIVKSLIWWAVLLAAVMEVISWVGNGVIFHYILRANHQNLSIGKGALIAIGTLAISLVAGGAVGLAMCYGWIYKENHDGNTAFLAGTLPSFFNTGSMIAVSIIGTAYLLFEHDLRRGQLIEFAIALLFLGFIAALAIVALRAENIVKRVGVWTMSRWANLRRKPYSSDGTIQTVDRFYIASRSMANGKWLFPLAGAIINVGFDMMAMFFLFIAAGHPITLGTLSAGYGLPLVLGKLAFMFPGGIGVIEGSMVVLFNSLNVPNAVSVVAVMGYRLLSFWLPTIFGFIAAAYLSGRLFGSKVRKV